MVSDRSVDLASGHPNTLQYTGPKPPAPRNLTATVAPRTITIRWLPPDNVTSNGRVVAPKFTCYVIEFISGSAEMDWRQLANVSANTESFVLTNPAPKVVYRFRIAACLASTVGYYSEVYVVTSADALGIMQVSTETALLGIAGCAVVLIVIISVVIICVRFNRQPTPYDRHRQRQCKFISIDGSPLKANSTPPNKQLLLNTGSHGYGGGLLTTATVGNNPNINCSTSNSMGNCNAGLLLGSSSSSNSAGTATTLPQ